MDASEPPRLVTRVRDRIRFKHYSLRTEEAYVDWIKRFIVFHNKRHPSELGAVEVEAFLTNLAVERNASASHRIKPRAPFYFYTGKCPAMNCRGSPGLKARSARSDYP